MYVGGGNVPALKKGRSKMRKRTKKQVRIRLEKLAKNCHKTSFNSGLSSDRKWNRLSNMAQQAFWIEFYSYFGADDLPF